MTPRRDHSVPGSAQVESALPLSPPVFEILVSLATGPLHGYGILLDLRERTQGRVRLETGPLYRHLKRLLEDGWVEEADPPAEDEGEVDERRRYYRISALGAAVLAAETRRLQASLARVREAGVL